MISISRSLQLYNINRRGNLISYEYHRHMILSPLLPIHELPFYWAEEHCEF